MHTQNQYIKYIIKKRESDTEEGLLQVKVVVLGLIEVYRGTHWNENHNGSICRAFQTRSRETIKWAELMDEFSSYLEMWMFLTSLTTDTWTIRTIGCESLGEHHECIRLRLRDTSILFLHSYHSHQPCRPSSSYALNSSPVLLLFLQSKQSTHSEVSEPLPPDLQSWDLR